MDDIYKINVAKTEFREAYNTGEVDRLLAVFTDDGFTSMFESGPSQFGGRARSSLREEAVKLFADYSVQMNVIIIDIIVQGGTAYDCGWHEFTLRPKDGGEPIRKRLPTLSCGAKILQATGRSPFTSTIRTCAKSSAEA